jgi:hypothetical protein
MSTDNEDVELLVSRWIAVPRSFTKSIGDVDTNKHAELAVDDVKSPESEIARKAYAFCKGTAAGASIQSQHALMVLRSLSLNRENGKNGLKRK